MKKSYYLLSMKNETNQVNTCWTCTKFYPTKIYNLDSHVNPLMCNGFLAWLRKVQTSPQKVFNFYRNSHIQSNSFNQVIILFNIPKC